MPDCQGVIRLDKQHRDYLSFSKGLLIHHHEDFLYYALPRNIDGKLIANSLYLFIALILQYYDDSESDAGDEGEVSIKLVKLM